MIFLTVIIFCLFLLLVFYSYSVRTFDYWKKRGIKHDKPIPLFGTNFKQFIQKASITMVSVEQYYKYPDEKVVGFYRSSDPELLVRDLDIIKRILSTDFRDFYARGLHPHKTVIEPMLKNLFFADGDLWRLLRQRITPTFSTGKLKAMFPYIIDRAEKLQLTVEKISNSTGVCDVKDLIARYTTDFIGVCGFGLDMEALNEENSQFRQLGKRIFTRTAPDGFRAALKYMFPELAKNITFLDPSIEKSMVYLVNTVVKERNYQSSGKNDFIDLLLDVKNSGVMVGESIEEKNPDGSAKMAQIQLDDLLLTAQVFVFFGAGFETSSSASSYALHQLAFNPECLDKVHKEIDTVLARYNNKLCYDAVKEMTYLEMVLLEGMRMYPSVGHLVRECTSPEYTIPEIGVSINRGVKVLIPIKAIHNDPQYFKDPERFIPERFHPDIKNKMHKYAYLAFGEGPRACVGARLGIMQSIAGLAAVLQKFTLEPAAESKRNPIPDPAATIAEGIIGGLPLRLIKRKQFYPRNIG